jgi:hypothetical protein
MPIESRKSKIYIEEQIEKVIAFADQRAYVVAQKAVEAHVTKSKLRI